MKNFWRLAKKLIYVHDEFPLLLKHFLQFCPYSRALAHGAVVNVSGVPVANVLQVHKCKSILSFLRNIFLGLLIVLGRFAPLRSKSWHIHMRRTLGYHVSVSENSMMSLATI
jgi:hypothetical protein